MRKSKKILYLFAILGSLFTLVSVSYAYLRTRNTQTNNNNVAALDCLSVTFTSEADDINLTNAYPITDLGGDATTPYKFTLKNNCDIDVSTSINLESLNPNSLSSDDYLNSYLSDSYIKVKLNSVNYDINTTDILSNYADADKTESTAITSHKIKSILLEKQEEKSFELRLWIDEDVTWEEGQGKNYTGKMVVLATPVPDLTLASMIRALYPKVQSTLTVPGTQISTSSEAILASTLDDYGTSYYFRGAVTNNYVQFAGKCWRIVRITGNGAIKIVLHNDNINNVSNPCNAANNDANAAFARYNGTTYTSSFNNYNSNAYVGFMYGNINGTTYAETHANTNKSNMLQSLEKWYIKTFTYTDENNVMHDKDIVSKLADTIWCNDKSTYKSDTTYNPFNIGTIGTDYGVGKNVNYYSAVARLVSSTGGLGGTGPTLICPNDDNGGKLSKFTVDDTTYGNGDLTYKIGLLTADEIVFAGSGRANNNSYYLYENASGSWWWSLTPAAFNSSGYARGFYVPANGYLYDRWVSLGLGVRPAVSLVSSIRITGGIGTSSDPFIVGDGV